MRSRGHFRQCDGVRVTVVEHNRKISWRGVNVKMMRVEPKEARGVLDTLSKFDDVARLFALSSSIDFRQEYLR